jgi:hypothetical protein
VGRGSSLLLNILNIFKNGLDNRLYVSKRSGVRYTKVDKNNKCYFCIKTKQTATLLSQVRSMV